MFIIKYSIADLIVRMEPDPKTKQQAEKYLCNQDLQHDLDVFYIDYETYLKKDTKSTYEVYKYVSMSADFYRKLIDYNGIMLHASAIVVDDKAYLFSAPSGTGKSTHTGKWLELFGESAYILNDDKPAIRVLDDGIYAYGTPWSGKCDISVNKKVKLQGICFLERDKKNYIELMDNVTSIFRLYHATLKKLSFEQINRVMDIIDSIVNKIPIYKMGCTPTVEAAKMAYDAMSKSEVK